MSGWPRVALSPRAWRRIGLAICGLSAALVVVGVVLLPLWVSLVFVAAYAAIVASWFVPRRARK